MVGAQRCGLRYLHRAADPPGRRRRLASHIAFIVRDDDGGSDLLVQTSDTTWQAYNQYGGYSLYGGPPGHAHKVSYNRPFTTRDTPTEDWLFNAEYPMVRWLERNGYDVSYFTDVDSDRNGAEILEHNVFMSVRPRRVLVGRTARQRHRRPRCRRGPRLLQQQRDLLEDALGAFRRRLGDAIPDAGRLQGRQCGAVGSREHWDCNDNFACDPDPNTWTGLWRQTTTRP